MTCSVIDCEARAEKRGWCNKHYRRWRKYGDPLTLKKTPNGEAPDRCTIDGCGRPHHAKGFCAIHTGRVRYHGDPLAGGPERIVGDTERRFWAFVKKGDGCWHFSGSIASNGYGRFFTTDGVVAAHRFAYEETVGPVPDGLDLDHLCHNRDRSCPGGWDCAHRRCVNPAHLEPASRSLNMKRAFARTGPR
jgi:hypothetical protein